MCLMADGCLAVWLLAGSLARLLSGAVVCGRCLRRVRRWERLCSLRVAGGQGVITEVTALRSLCTEVTL